MAEIGMNASQTEFPENRIVLFNGSELECFPKVRNDGEVKKDGCEFFLKYAFLFFRNAHRILKDSRMFLAPVPVGSGLAYTGSSGLNNPTLGVYIEWWLNCSTDLTKDREGREALTFRFAGSPLSGSNHCKCVYPDGTTAVITHNRFYPVWRMFMEINRRYDKAKWMYDAYTLEEVVDILLGSEQNRESELEVMLLVEEGRTNMAKRALEGLKMRYEGLQSNYKELSILLHKDELEAFRTEYWEMKRKADLEVESLDAARKEFRARMKRGEIDNFEYQRAITPLTRRRKLLEHELITLKAEKSVALVKSGHITYAIIDEYLYSNQEG